LVGSVVCGVGTQWFRVDLVFFHRRLRCLVVVDLKVGHFTHADAGKMPSIEPLSPTSVCSPLPSRREDGSSKRAKRRSPLAGNVDGRGGDVGLIRNVRQKDYG
jgi:hypothetical protein